MELPQKDIVNNFKVNLNMDINFKVNLNMDINFIVNNFKVIIWSINSKSI